MQPESSTEWHWVLLKIARVKMRSHAIPSPQIQQTDERQAENTGCVFHSRISCLSFQGCRAYTQTGHSSVPVPTRAQGPGGTSWVDPCCCGSPGIPPSGGSLSHRVSQAVGMGCWVPPLSAATVMCSSFTRAMISVSGERRGSCASWWRKGKSTEAGQRV